MNSIRKTKFLSSTLNKNLRFKNSKLFLHLKWYLTIMLVNFYLNKRIFPHGITLIASVVGESVISHLAMVMAGSLSLLKWRNLLTATRWSKQQQKLVTRSYSHSNRK